jgi:hypothetical protein
MEQARQVEDQKRSVEEPMHSQEYDAPPIDLPKAGWRWSASGLVNKLGQFVVNFLKAEDGPTAVEYAVILALIIVVCIAAITTLT